MQTNQPDLGETAVALLGSPQPPSFEAVMTALINELVETSTRCHILVLDDYHLATNTAVHQALAFLLEHIPGNLHLVLITRPTHPCRWLQGHGFAFVIILRPDTVIHFRGRTCRLGAYDTVAYAPLLLTNAIHRGHKPVKIHIVISRLGDIVWYCRHIWPRLVLQTG